MKKRMVTLILALLLALSLTGCGSRDTEKDGENAGIGTQSTDDASTLPDTAQDRPVTDAPMMVMVDNTLYQSAGEVSTVEGRCGNMDGEITAAVDHTQRPAEDNTSNFGTGYGYQFCDGHVELKIDGKWIVFDPVPDSHR